MSVPIVDSDREGGAPCRVPAIIGSWYTQFEYWSSKKQKIAHLARPGPAFRPIGTNSTLALVLCNPLQPNVCTSSLASLLFGWLGANEYSLGLGLILSLSYSELPRDC